MKKGLLQLVLAGLFALSVGVAGAVIAETASAAPRPLAPCPDCNMSQLNCPGSTCTCAYNTTQNKYLCSKPSP